MWTPSHITSGHEVSAASRLRTRGSLEPPRRSWWATDRSGHRVALDRRGRRYLGSSGERRQGHHAQCRAQRGGRKDSWPMHGAGTPPATATRSGLRPRDRSAPIRSPPLAISRDLVQPWTMTGRSGHCGAGPRRLDMSHPSSILWRCA